MTIWKYVLKPTCELEMPKGAQILSVQTQQQMNVGSGAQSEEVCLWALVDPAQPKETRRFSVFGTGHTVLTDVGMRFLGTVQLELGRLVFHVFEVLQ